MHRWGSVEVTKYSIKVYMISECIHKMSDFNYKGFQWLCPVFRAFLCVGFFLSALWAGIHVCAPDAFAWSIGLVFLNAVHTAILACRFLPPPLSIELTELYLKLFKPLRVSKKHFKELTREGQLLHLEPGETYAVEEVTPADERLSVLLRGK